MFLKHRNFVQEHKNFDQENMEFLSIGFSNCEDEQFEDYKQNKTQFSFNFPSIFMVLLLHGANKIVYITNK
jgi:hypothetical protein